MMNDIINELFDFSQKYTISDLTEINGVKFPADAALFFKDSINGWNDYIWFITPYDKKWNEIIQEQRESYLFLKNDFDQDSIVLGDAPKDGEGYPFDFFPDENGLIPWAVCDNGTAFFWKPDNCRITIVIYGDSYEYYEYSMTTTKFLYKLLNNEIKEIYKFLPRDIFENGIVCC